MFKRIAVALAGLLAMLSIAAAPASAGTAADTMILHTATNFGGNSQTVDIATGGCKVIPAAVSPTRSVKNLSTNLSVAFFAAPAVPGQPACTTLLAVVPASSQDSGDPLTVGTATLGQVGATHYQVVS